MVNMFKQKELQMIKSETIEEKKKKKKSEDLVAYLPAEVVTAPAVVQEVAVAAVVASARLPSLEEEVERTCQLVGLASLPPPEVPIASLSSAASQLPLWRLVSSLPVQRSYSQSVTAALPPTLYSAIIKKKDNVSCGVLTKNLQQYTSARWYSGSVLESCLH